MLEGLERILSDDISVNIDPNEIQPYHDDFIRKSSCSSTSKQSSQNVSTENDEESTNSSAPVSQCEKEFELENKPYIKKKNRNFSIGSSSLSEDSFSSDDTSDKDKDDEDYAETSDEEMEEERDVKPMILRSRKVNRQRKTSRQHQRELVTSNKKSKY